MADNTTGVEGTELRNLWRLALLFLLSAVFFFPMILNPITIDLFEAESDAAALVHAQENLGALRILFAGIGVTELALGIALWLWGRQVSGHTPGRRGSVAKAFSWVALVTGCVALVTRLIPWFSDAEQLASDPPSAVIAISFVAWVGFSVSFIVFGMLMIRGAMPTWLGVVWILCGVLFWATGFLPLWFFVGSLTLGIWGLLKFRPNSGTVEQIATVRPD